MINFDKRLTTLGKTPFFPAALPDDSVYGWICRYHQLSGNAHPKETRKQLLGVFHHWPDKGLARELLMGMSVATDTDLDYLIDHHTQLPLCAWLNHGRLYDNQDCLANSGIEQELFPNWTFPAPARMHLWRDRPKVCMTCHEEDQQTVGHAYWHLYHQPQFVTVCAKHGTRLLFGCPQCGMPLCHKAFGLPIPKCRRCDDLTITPGYVNHFRVAQIELLIAQLTRSFINVHRRPRLDWNYADGCRRVAAHVGVSAEDFLEEWTEPRQYVSATEYDLNATKESWGVWVRQFWDHYDPPDRLFDGFQVPEIYAPFISYVLQDPHESYCSASTILWLLAYAVTRGVAVDDVVRIYMGDDYLQ